MSVTDADDGLKYYAQLRGFLEDQYYRKSAVITWLVPRTQAGSSHGIDNSQLHSFDPSLFVAGSTLLQSCSYAAFFVLRRISSSLLYNK